MPATLIGHLQAQSRLANLLETGRFPHATLIHGPRGIGKFLLAQHLAWRLICGPQPLETSMFGAGEGPGIAYNEDSPQAAQLAAHSCPDYHVLTVEDGKKSIGIKQVKELLETLGRSADTARTIILDALEDLTDEASNTLLKTLEEPRPGIYFFLISHQLSAVLPTIRSRCRLLPLQPLSRDEVAQVLALAGANPALAVTAGGAPGSVLGKGGEAREKLLNTLKSHEFPAPASEGLLPALMQHIAAQPRSLARADTYFAVKHLHEKQQEINLPQALVNEAAMAKIIHD